MFHTLKIIATFQKVTFLLPANDRMVMVISNNNLECQGKQDAHNGTGIGRAISLLCTCMQENLIKTLKEKNILSAQESTMINRMTLQPLVLIDSKMSSNISLLHCLLSQCCCVLQEWFNDLSLAKKNLLPPLLSENQCSNIRL